MNDTKMKIYQNQIDEIEEVIKMMNSNKELMFLRLSTQAEIATQLVINTNNHYRRSFTPILYDGVML